MYTPPAFAESDPRRLFDYIDAHPLATLVSTAPDGEIMATHLPLLLDRAAGVHGTLVGHLARANAQHRQLAGGRPALVIFAGPDAYITPSWYPSKQEHARVVPTWNYVAVHARVVPRVIEDPAWLRAHVEALTGRHEAGRDVQWKQNDAPADYVEAQQRGLVGVELAITGLEGKWKMSQNRSDADITGVVEGLSASPDPSAHHVAALVAASRPARG
jgi:transcriptional regulator